MSDKYIIAGGVKIGGGAPVSVQSMTNTKTEDVPATVRQILSLEEAGCDIVVSYTHLNMGPVCTESPPMAKRRLRSSRNMLPGVWPGIENTSKI